MLERCRNPHNISYPDYGGRGITVCERWHDFSCFYRDMGDPPPGTQLERRDNNQPYAPDNCYWVTRLEQANNKRNNVKLTFDGQTLSLSQWSERTLGSRFLRSPCAPNGDGP